MAHVTGEKMCGLVDALATGFSMLCLFCHALAGLQDQPSSDDVARTFVKMRVRYRAEAAKQGVEPETDDTLWCLDACELGRWCRLVRLLW